MLAAAAGFAAAVLSVAVAAGLFPWRVAWLSFAAAALALAAIAAAGLPPGKRRRRPGPVEEIVKAALPSSLGGEPEPNVEAAAAHLVRRVTLPLYGTALVFGMMNAIFLSFAADRVVAASGLHGIAIMVVSAVFSFWSLRLFSGRGTLGFTATLLAMAVGAVAGPALAGLLTASQGFVVMFLAAAVPPLATALWFAALLPRPRPRLQEAAE